MQKLSLQGDRVASPDVRFASGFAGKELIEVKISLLDPGSDGLRTIVRKNRTAENLREYPSMFAVSTNCREKTSGNEWSSPNA